MYICCLYCVESDMMLMCYSTWIYWFFFIQIMLHFCQFLSSNVFQQVWENRGVQLANHRKRNHSPQKVQKEVTMKEIDKKAAGSWTIDNNPHSSAVKNSCHSNLKVRYWQDFNQMEIHLYRICVIFFFFKNLMYTQNRPINK